MDESSFLALPDSQRKELQKQWAAQGLYVGPIDGKGGAGVRGALRTLADRQRRDAEAAAASKSQDQSFELQKMKLQQDAAAAAAKKEQDDREAAERRAREDSADPISGIAVPAGIGMAAGAGASHLINSIVSAGDRARVRAINEIGDEIGPTSGLTASQTNRARAVGAAKAAERFAPAGTGGKLMQLLARGASYGVPGAVVLNEYKRYEDVAEDESRPWAERQAASKVANGFLGAGSGILAEGAARAFNPIGADGEGRSMMRIEAARDLAKRMDEADAARSAQASAGSTSRLRQVLGAADETAVQPALPQPSAPAPTQRNADSLQAAAKAAGAKGRLSKSEAVAHLAGNITDENRAAVARALGVSPKGPNLGGRIGAAISKMSSKAGVVPLVAGATAAGLSMTGDASAADGTPVTPGDMLGDAAISAGVAGGAAYGASKAAPSLLRALGASSVAMAPFAAADMSDEYAMDDQQKARDRNWIARNIPGAGYLPGEIGRAYDMATVPERGDRSPETMAARQETPAPELDYDQLLAASEADPELAAMLRDAISARLNGINPAQMAMASQSAGQVDPMVAALRGMR